MGGRNYLYADIPSALLSRAPQHYLANDLAIRRSPFRCLGCNDLRQTGLNHEKQTSDHTNAAASQTKAMDLHYLQSTYLSENIIIKNIHG